ncbi:MAG: imidazole glycerol phosphate synthase subunit HisH [Candidatus Nanopelagicaceae bacterium]|nr:imidazole glycerol phosphate synthase subunit HisH [Candidatus Nanopelagicaceae bacterium]
MIAILDYGSGNLRSALRAFSTSDRDVVVTADRKICLEADGLVVPGVGAFQSCMNGLLSVGGDEIIRERKDKNRPILGICIGMQIFFSEGLEPSRDHAGASKGVGIWPGSVSRIESPVLPHMGWNTVTSAAGSQLFKGVEDESFYFVHSFAAKTAIGKGTSWSEYGERFVSAVEDGTVSATQFHPEKSGKAGLSLIKNWTRSL